MVKIIGRERAPLSLRRALSIIPLHGLVLSILMAPTLAPGQQASKMELKTSSFEPSGFIPKRFTCEGENVAPEVEWRNPPAGTQSYAIIEDDPDAPSGTFVHWVVYNVPAKYTRISEGMLKNDAMTPGIRQGTNDFSSIGYSGPCPPPGKAHRYFIRLYALDTTTSLHPAATREELDAAMQGHILARAELMGRFKR